MMRPLPLIIACLLFSACTEEPPIDPTGQESEAETSESSGGSAGDESTTIVDLGSDDGMAAAPSILALTVAGDPGDVVLSRAADVEVRAWVSGEVAAVDFHLDGELLASDDAAPFTTTLSLRSAAQNGAHSLTATIVGADPVARTVTYAMPPPGTVVSTVALWDREVYRVSGLGLDGEGALVAGYSSDFALLRLSGGVLSGLITGPLLHDRVAVGSDGRVVATLGKLNAGAYDIELSSWGPDLALEWSGLAFDRPQSIVLARLGALDDGFYVAGALVEGNEQDPWFQRFTLAADGSVVPHEELWRSSEDGFFTYAHRGGEGALFLGHEGGGGSTLRKYDEGFTLIWSRDTKVNGQTHTPWRILTLADGHVVLGHFYGFDLYSADGYLASSLSVDGYGSDVAVDAQRIIRVIGVSQQGVIVDAFDHDLEPLWTRTLALDSGSRPQTVIDPLGYTWVAAMFRPDGASESRPMVLALHP